MLQLFKTGMRLISQGNYSSLLKRIWEKLYKEYYNFLFIFNEKINPNYEIRVKNKKTLMAYAI